MQLATLAAHSTSTVLYPAGPRRNEHWEIRFMKQNTLRSRKSDQPMLIYVSLVLAIVILIYLTLH